MGSIHDSLAPWQGFYTLMGEASATMTGLLFVAASVGSGMFSRDRPGALRMFLSASVVQFASVLAGSLIVLAPIDRWAELGGAAMVLGAFGLGYCGMAWRDTVRDGIAQRIDLDDRVWYAVAPAVAYACVAAAGAALIARVDAGCALLAAAMGALMLVAIHNAWDITVWSITRRRD